MSEEDPKLPVITSERVLPPTEIDTSVSEMDSSVLIELSRNDRKVNEGIYLEPDQAEDLADEISMAAKQARHVDQVEQSDD